MEDSLDAEEVMQLLGIKQQTLYAYASRGLLRKTSAPEARRSRYAREDVERLLARPTLALSLIELRLEAAMTPALAVRIGPFLRAGLDADVSFHAQRGLPGSRDAVIALHHLVNGLVLDRLTISLDPEADPAETIASIVGALVSGGLTDAG